METKIAIVTGANKGLGYALVKGLCEKYNRTVYLTSRNEERGKDACKKLKESGFDPVYHQLDITDKGSVSRFQNHVRENNISIDILVNNAGVLFLKDATEPKIYQAEYTMFVNFFCLVRFCEQMQQLMKNGGRIVNISSSSGHLSRIPSVELRTKIKTVASVEKLEDLMEEYVEAVRKGKEIETGWGDSPYVVSKVAVNAYTFILNRKLEDKGILVNCVHPGYVISDMTKGAGNVTPDNATEVPLKLALEVQQGGMYLWHNGAQVDWDGNDPREYIDGKKL